MTDAGQFWTPPSGVYNAAIDMVDRNVSEGRGGKTAFIDPATQLTYGQLRERCDRAANALRGLGVAREHRIVLIMTDHSDYDYRDIVSKSRLVVDSRNATKGIESAKIVRC